MVKAKVKSKSKTKNESKNKARKSVFLCVVLIVIPLAVGGISAALTDDAMSRFSDMSQPPLSPPGWVFPVAWSILYVLMGIASYLVYLKNNNFSKSWLTIYSVQLFFNFCWSPIFFNFKLYYLALIWLLIMWATIIALVVKAKKISIGAMWMLVPYLIWCTFAAYLNAGVAILN